MKKMRYSNYFAAPVLNMFETRYFGEVGGRVALLKPLVNGISSFFFKAFATCRKLIGEGVRVHGGGTGGGGGSDRWQWRPTVDAAQEIRRW